MSESLIRRKYTIEASNRTLAFFTKETSLADNGDAFVEKLVCDSTDEYYYVTVLATKRVHKSLNDARFTTSVLLKL